LGVGWGERLDNGAEGSRVQSAPVVSLLGARNGAGPLVLRLAYSVDITARISRAGEERPGNSEPGR
jgi:hypothetical protein